MTPAQAHALNGCLFAALVMVVSGGCGFAAVGVIPWPVAAVTSGAVLLGWLTAAASVTATITPDRGVDGNGDR